SLVRGQLSSSSAGSSSAAGNNNVIFQNVFNDLVQLDLQLLLGGGTNLQSQGGTQLRSGAIGNATEQRVVGTIAGILHDVVQLSAQSAELSIQCFNVLGAIGAVGGLGGQVLHAQHDVGEFVQRAFGGLQHGDAVLGVALGNGLAASLGVQAGGDLQAGGVVGGAVHTVPGTQALLAETQRGVGLGHVGLGEQSGVVGMNRDGHGGLLQIILSCGKLASIAR